MKITSKLRASKRAKAIDEETNGFRYDSEFENPIIEW
jgi:hypothetical protein